MKKLIILMSLLLISCSDNPQPIEKYEGKGYVVAMIGANYGNTQIIQLKSKDTIIIVTILCFDAKNLKVGDSLK